MKRISFSEITKPAVERALAAPRSVDQSLVEAYIARISADYLLGFSVSPMLWKKLPGAKSAGRVQSVALRLVCDREAQRDMHESVKFFTATAHLDGKPHCEQVCVCLPSAGQGSRAALSIGLPITGGALFLVPQMLESCNGSTCIVVSRSCLDLLQVAATVLVDGKPKFDEDPSVGDESVMSRLKSAGNAAVKSVSNGCRSQKPPRPYTTARLQQDASRFLGFTAKQTMSLAQSLFEGMSGADAAV